MKTSHSPLKHLLMLLAFSAFAAQASAAIISFNLIGKGGVGLLGSNINGAVANPGSGGEFGQGVYFDDVDSRLYVLIEWGSTNGYTDLTGSATGQFLHGPTASSGVASFTEDASVLFPMQALAFIVNPSASDGSINGSAPLTAPQAADLLAGRLYITIATAANPAGEIRANITLVPEPATATLSLIALAGGLFRRRR